MHIGWLSLSLAALTLAPVTHAGAAASPLRIHLDCQPCDFEFLQGEMGYVDWVRDRRDADLRVLVTTRATGAGGTEWQLFVTRRAGGGPAADTLRIETPPGASADDTRRVLARALQVIVARDLVDRPEFDRLSVAVTAARTHDPAPTRDPWNAWVFSVSASGYADGQQSSRALNLVGDASASRVTEGGKISLTGQGNYAESRYTFDDGSSFFSVRRGHGADLRAVASVSPRWSAGVRGFYSSSSFANVDLEVGGGPALEFDVWPYRESSRRLATLAYEATGRWVEYQEVTLFGRIEERLWRHQITLKLSARQPWGAITVTGEARQNLLFTDKRRLTASGSLSFNLVRGFSLNMSGFASQVRDQLALRRSGASDEQVIARQRQLATSYEYFASAGLSYTFGSIYNAVVNPRMNAIYGSF